MAISDDVAPMLAEHYAGQGNSTAARNLASAMKARRAKKKSIEKETKGEEERRRKERAAND